MLIKSCLVLLCLHFAVAQQEDNYTEVFIATGKIRGRIHIVKREQNDEKFALVSSFLGIPYAKPPVGDLRFKRTEPAEPFDEDPLVVDKMPPACPQYSKDAYPWYDSDPGQSEDCLYLNVWAPMDAITHGEKRPVKFYVHGDGWLTFGSNRMGYYDGKGDAFDYDEKNGVLVVTINYRLGVMGFLSSGSDDAPGNIGLYDIVTALEWVRDNIAAFGGDPNDVALVGQGGGAIAASLLLQAPRTKGLFSVLILDGSSLFSLKAAIKNNGGDSYDNNIKLVGKLSEAVGCDSDITENTTDTVQCLRAVEASKLVEVLSSFSPMNQKPPNVFLPQFGQDDLVPADPFSDVHSMEQFVLLGFTGDEGSHLLTQISPEDFGGVFGEKDVGISAKQSKNILKRFLADYPESVVDELLDDLDEEPTTENRKKVYKAMGATFVVCPAVYLAEKFVDKGNKVFIVEKQVYPPYNPWADWMGSVHFSNVQTDYVRLEEPLVVNGKYYTYTEQQRQLSFKFKENILNQAWVQFTKEDRMYSVLDQNIEGFDGEPQSSPGGRSCEILRPYVVGMDGNVMDGCCSNEESLIIPKYKS